jgi:hypothetical protein
VRKIQRVGDVYEDLAVEIVLAGQFERLHRDGTGGGVDDHLTVGSRFAERAEPYFRVLLLPGAERGIAVSVRLGTGQRLFRVAGTDHYLMFQAGQPGGHRLSDHAGAKDT